MKSSLHLNVVVNLVRTIAMTLLSFITFPIVCRYLGDQALGTFSWVTSFVYYFIVLSKISIPNIAVRECAKVKNDPEKLSMKIQEFYILQAIMTLFSFLFMCLLVFTIPTLKENYQNLIFIVSINFLASVFAFDWVFTALEKQTYIAIRSIIVLAITDILIFMFVKYPEHIYLYAFLTTLTTTLTMISNLIYLPKLVKFKKTGPYNFKQYLPSLGILFGISFVTAIYSKTDSFILGLIDESKASVGSYSVGMKGVDIVIGIITALSSVFMPRASQYFHKGESNNYKNLNRYSTNLCLLITVPAIALLAALSSPVTSLISGSNGYKDASGVLLALCSLIITYSVSYIIYTQILIPQKKETVYLFIMAIGSSINIGLSLLFGLVVTKDNPAVGIAIATSISDLIILICLLGLTWKDSKKMLFNFNNLKIVFIGIAIFLFSFFVGPLIYNNFKDKMTNEYALLLEIGLVFLLDAVIYVISLYFSKEKLTRSILNK